MSNRSNCWWTKQQLKDWYKWKMLKVSNIENYYARTEEYEAWTRIFHVGLKFCEHWPFWKISTTVANIEDRIERGMQPLLALKEIVKKKTGDFVSFEVSKSFSINGILDEKTNTLIREYKEQTSSPKSLNSRMSKEGQEFLVEVYHFIKDEMKKSDPRGALKDALTSSIFLPRGTL